MTCQTPGCRREALASSSGTRYSHCADCTRAILRDAFGEPRSWWQRAKAGQLPTLVVGGKAA